jgi:hypothetical protein
MFRVLDNTGAAGYAALLVIAIVCIWLGVRYSRPSR